MYPVRMISSRLSLLSFVAILSVSAFAAEPRFPNTEDLRHIKAVGGAALSPDGKEVLFALTDTTADGAKSHIWMIPVDGGSARQLTFSPSPDKRGERGAVWSPDGSAIFFLAKRGETTQIFRLPMNGGEASPYDLKVVPVVDDSKDKNFIPPAKDSEKATDSKSADKKPEAKSDAKPDALAINPGGFSLSPDGKWLAVWAEDPETPAEKKAKDLVARARKGERFAEMARDNSDSVSAKGMGELPPYKKGVLSKNLEDLVWNQPKGYITDPIQSSNGFLILRVEDHQKAGQAELSEVENRINEILLAPRLDAAVRDYLTKLRKDAFLEIKADYIDTGAAGGKDTAWVDPAQLKPDTVKKEDVESYIRHKRLLWAIPVPGTQTVATSSSAI